MSLASSRRSQTITQRGTPASSRRHANDNDNNNSDRRRPSTPEYEPLCTPLNATGQRALAALLSASTFRQLKKHLDQAGEKLAETAAEVNEKATVARIRYERGKNVAVQKKKNKKQQQKAASRKRSRTATGMDEEQQESAEDNEMKEDDEDDEDDDEEEEEEEEEEDEEDEENDDADDSEARKLQQLEGKVKEVTAQLDERMRGVVDGDHKLSAMQEVVEQVHRAAEEAGAAANARERQARLRNRRSMVEDEDQDEDVDMEADEDHQEAVTVVPTQLLAEKLNAVDAQWEAQSLTQRYAQDNNYIGFYRIVHDAKHPGDEIPPVPHPSTWFSHLENSSSAAAADGSASPAPGRIRDGQSPDEEDEEIAIERERISLKCPLTFSTFQDPVKSTKCVHSFERQAIQDLIRNSAMTVAAGPQDYQGGGRSARARRVRAVQCPVCSVALTLNDLKPDPVVLRRVLRAKATEQREEEEAHFERTSHHRKGGRKSGFTIASDDEVSIDDDDDDDNDNTGDGRRDNIHIKREASRFSSRAPPRDADEIEDDDD